jgi:hypothetical protein
MYVCMYVYVCGSRSVSHCCGSHLGRDSVQAACRGLDLFKNRRRPTPTQTRHNTQPVALSACPLRSQYARCVLSMPVDLCPCAQLGLKVSLLQQPFLGRQPLHVTHHQGGQGRGGGRHAKSANSSSATALHSDKHRDIHCFGHEQHCCS